MATTDPPTFGFFPGVCIGCQKETRIGAPWFYTLTPDGPKRWAVENLRGHCEDCLKAMGLNRKGYFVPVGELVPIPKAIEAEAERIKPIRHDLWVKAINGLVEAGMPREEAVTFLPEEV